MTTGAKLGSDGHTTEAVLLTEVKVKCGGVDHFSQTGNDCHHMQHRYLFSSACNLGPKGWVFAFLTGNSGPSKLPSPFKALSVRPSGLTSSLRELTVFEITGDCPTELLPSLPKLLRGLWMQQFM